jgi:NAD-dependent DNA ligase
MSYPGADASIKKHLWTTIYRPTLLYGMECVELSKTTLSRLETVQGNHLKQSLGLSKTARASYLLDSLNIPHIQSVLSKKCATFYHSIFKCDTPAAELNSHSLASCITSGELIKGTLIHKIVTFGL